MSEHRLAWRKRENILSKTRILHEDNTGMNEQEKHADTHTHTCIEKSWNHSSCWKCLTSSTPPTATSKRHRITMTYAHKIVRPPISPLWRPPTLFPLRLSPKKEMTTRFSLCARHFLLGHSKRSHQADSKSHQSSPHRQKTHWKCLDVPGIWLTLTRSTAELPHHAPTVVSGSAISNWNKGSFLPVGLGRKERKAGEEKTNPC